MKIDYLRILEELPYGVTIQDAKGILIYANRQAANLMGFKQPTSTITKSIKHIRDKYLLLDEQGNPFPYSKLPGRIALKSKKQEEAIIRFRKAGTTSDRWSRVVSVPILTDSRSLSYVINAFFDYTAYEKELEKTKLIRENEKTLLLALDVGNMGVWDWDIQSNSFSWSDGLRPTQDLRRGNQLGTFEKFIEHVHPDDRPVVKTEFRRALRSLNRYEGEFRIITSEGNIRWMYKRGEVHRDGRGKPVRMIGIGMNITKRKSTELILAHNEQKFKSVFDSAIDAMIIADTQLRIHDVNKAAMKLYTQSYKSLLFTSLTSLMTKQSRHHFSESWKNLLKRGSLRGEITIEPVPGTRKILEYSVRASFLPDRHILIFRDITNRIAEEQRREHLLGLASHELRTPLASIKAFVELLKRELVKTKNDKAHAYVSKIDEKTDTVTRLINDLLDVARIRDNRLELYPTAFDFDQFVSELVGDIQIAVTSHTLQIKGATNTTIHADKTRISQVLTNIIKNATRYSPDENRVVIEIHKRGNRILISVTDFGIGIPKKDLENIFRLFYKADLDSRKHLYGIGVGLYIARVIVELHGGSIWVVSKKGKGSTFYVSLPIYPRPMKKKIAANLAYV